MCRLRHALPEAALVRVLRPLPYRPSNLKSSTRDRDAQTEPRPLTGARGSREFVQQRIGFDQIFRIEAFGEPVVDGREQIVRFLAFALRLPQSRKAG